MFVYKIPKLLNRMMLTKPEFAVDHLDYNGDISVILFSCCLLSVIWLDALESQGRFCYLAKSYKGLMRVSESDTWLAKIKMSKN